MEGPQWTTGSIGRRCKPGNGLSRPVLIGRHEPHTPTRPRTPAPAPERAGAGGEPNPRVHYAAQNQPTHPPQRGPTKTAHHNPTTVPAATAGGETPGTIPNPEAKPPSANGTAPTRERKSRTPPEHTPTNRPARGRRPNQAPTPTRAGPTPAGRTRTHTQHRRLPPPHGRRDAAKAAKGEETQRSKPRWRAPTSPVGSLTPITPPATLTET